MMQLLVFAKLARTRRPLLPAGGWPPVGVGRTGNTEVPCWRGRKEGWGEGTRAVTRLRAGSAPERVSFGEKKEKSAENSYSLPKLAPPAIK